MYLHTTLHYIPTGIFAPAIAHQIHTANRAGGFHINLKGLLVESGWSDPIAQVDYGNFLYHIGFFDEEDRDYAIQQSEIIKTGIVEEKYDEAYLVIEQRLNFGRYSDIVCNLGISHYCVLIFEFE